MEFKNFREALQNNFEKIAKDENMLFQADIDSEYLWNLYLDSFPEGTNKIFRERREFDCSCCRSFIRNIGGAVFIKNNKISTIWDFKAGSETFQVVVNALDAYVKSKAIKDIYVSKLKKIGTKINYEKLDNGEVLTWEHLYLELPEGLYFNDNKSEGEIKGYYKDIKNVFQSSLEQISKESVEIVLELISSNTLYKGLEWKTQLEKFLKYKEEYSKIKADDKDNYLWSKSIDVGVSIGKIKNHSIGTLLLNISEGMDLDKAVSKYEKIVAPENYKRPKAIVTEKMIKDAQKTITDLGYLDSLNRRYATLDDISINNIVFSNRDAQKRIKNASNIFDELKEDIAIDKKKFSKTEEIQIEDFIKNVLPKTKEVEVLLENNHKNNMVSLIAPNIENSKSMFKWNNNFSWAYSGNIADSSMKNRVKAAGGDVEGVLRFSIQWNDGNSYNPNDFDAHCIEPNGYHIYYGKKNNNITSGKLDVDIRTPRRNTPAVENITWEDEKKMLEGTYSFYVKNFCHNGGRDGFKAEIEFDGNIYSFEYNKELNQKEEVLVAEVTYDKIKGFTLKEKLPSSTSSRELWNLTTNKFIPVSTIMYSPNYWDEQNGIGNKHYFFMLKNCVNNENPNSFYNEYLKPDLNQHRKVFELLGSKLKLESAEDQLSGVGFSSTQRNELIVKVKGQIERVFKIKF